MVLKHNIIPRVVADNKIPFLDTLLGDKVDLIQLDPDIIDSKAVKEADALITRTRTHCNANLLEGSRCRLVTTATIGTDHIDFDYCHSHNIKVVSAPGCNAPAVAQYVWASILRNIADHKHDITKVGVVGVGHVGSIVERWGRSMGFRMLLCDPPRAERERDSAFVDMETIARECDVITFHTPHTKTGPHATHHLANDAFFSSLTRKPLIINSARGPIVDTASLIEAIDNGKTGRVVIDCWEGEPTINYSLLARTEIATPHIAGYSLEGKTRASVMVARAVCQEFGLTFDCSIPQPPSAPDTVTASQIIESYNPYIDTAALKASPDTFEQQRNHYRLRHEVTHS